LTFCVQVGIREVERAGQKIARQFKNQDEASRGRLARGETMKLKLNVLMAGIALAICAVLADCGSGGSTNNTIPANTIALSCPAGACSVQTSAELASQTLQLAATCNGSTPCTTTATWTVASGGGSINNGGLYTSATSVPSGGSAVITASANGVSGSIDITITQGPTPVIVAYSNTTTLIEMVGAFNLSNPQGQVLLSSTPNYQLSAAVSPDQSLTAYISSGQLAIYTTPTAPVQGTSPTIVHQWTDSHFTLEDIDYNPSGSGFVIADLDPTNGVCGLQTLNKDGSNIQPIVATNVPCSLGSGINNFPSHARYLKNGSIVYASQAPGSGSGNSQLMLVATDGTATNISNDSWNDYSPSPSPDGTEILFTSDRVGDGKWHMYIMPASGNAATATALSDPGVHGLTFCPGNVVVYSDWATSDLWSLNVGTGETAQLTKNSGFELYCR
jgi:Tol biopolymer transport system component